VRGEVGGGAPAAGSTPSRRHGGGRLQPVHGLRVAALAVGAHAHLPPGRAPGLVRRQGHRLRRGSPDAAHDRDQDEGAPHLGHPL
jgi:hypothetical protein